MDIDELKLVLANIDEILNDDDLKTLMDGNYDNENKNAEFEGKFISLFHAMKFFSKSYIFYIFQTSTVALTFKNLTF